jgi:hypothetical protein
MKKKKETNKRRGTWPPLHDLNLKITSKNHLLYFPSPISFTDGKIIPSLFMATGAYFSFTQI